MADHPPTLRIGILLFNDFEPIDVWGFAEAFTIARFLGQDYDDAGPYPFEVRFIAKELKPVRSYNGPRAFPDYDLAQAEREHFDVLMVPGGMGTFKILENNDTAILDFIKAMDPKVGILASVCTGSSLLAKLGLLDGKPAATNHSAFSGVMQQGPRVLWDNVSRWVDAGHYVTSAGVSAGTDMGFYLVSRLSGRAVAELAAHDAEYDWHRDPRQPLHYPQQASVDRTLYKEKKPPQCPTDR
jgi:putative intracellular protease/amidase